MTRTANSSEPAGDQNVNTRTSPAGPGNHAIWISLIPTGKGLLLLALVFLGLRLIFIGEPLVDMHNVRQTQTAMIARNLLRDGFNVLYTRIDWAGNEPGYVLQEFPLYQLIVALLWKVFGQYDVIGRLVSLGCSIVSAICLYRVAGGLINRRVAFWAVAFFAICPISVFTSRAVMINMMALSLSLAALCEWVQVLREPTAGRICRAALLFTAAALANVTVVIPVAMVLAGTAFTNKLRERRWLLCLAAAALTCVGLMAGWNVHAAEVNQAFYPDWGASNVFGHVFGLSASRLNPYLWFRVVMYLAYFVVGVHGLLLIGISLARMSVVVGLGRKVLLWWMLGALAHYFVFFNALRGHNYYSLPIVPVLSVLAGLGAVRLIDWATARPGLTLRRAFIALYVVTLPMWLVFPVLHSVEQDDIAYTAARELRARSAPQDLVLIAVLHTDVASSVYPTILYHADRRGWNVATANDPKLDPAVVAARRAAGAKLMLVTFGASDHKPISSIFPFFRYFAHAPSLDVRPILAAIRAKYQIVVETQHYLIVRL